MSNPEQDPKRGDWTETCEETASELCGKGDDIQLGKGGERPQQVCNQSSDGDIGCDSRRNTCHPSRHGSDLKSHTLSIPDHAWTWLVEMAAIHGNIPVSRFLTLWIERTIARQKDKSK